MTTPTGAADERERLAASLHDRCPNGCRCSLQQAADMLRADAAEIAALRKDAERIMDGVQSAIGYFEPLYKQDRRIIGLSIVLNRLYAILERDALAAHGADTQG